MQETVLDSVLVCQPLVHVQQFGFRWRWYPLCGMGERSTAIDGDLVQCAMYNQYQKGEQMREVIPV